MLRLVVVLPVRFERSPRLHAMLSEEPHAVGTRVVVQGKRGPEIATVRSAVTRPRAVVTGRSMPAARAPPLAPPP